MKMSLFLTRNIGMAVKMPQLCSSNLSCSNNHDPYVLRQLCNQSSRATAASIMIIFPRKLKYKFKSPCFIAVGRARGGGGAFKCAGRQFVL
jgi:hypothetical protein